MTYLLAFALSPLILLTGFLAVELFIGSRPLALAPSVRARSSTATIIVPAHNEASILEPRLDALKAAASSSSTEILVVADNCTDRTAAIAKAAGVRVVERHDPERRGKGYALDFGRQELGGSSPDAVIVIDADCTTDARSLEQLVALCLASGRPCQAINLQTAATDDLPAVQLSTFAFYVKNVIRQRALQRLAKQVHLLGTGMAFPWPVFAAASLATDEIVEDLALGLELAEMGFRPILNEHAAVWSEPETQANTLVQRGRWEGGFLANALRAGPRMFARSVGNMDARGLWAAIDVMIPPLALLIIVDLLALAAATPLILLAGAAAWPALVLGGALLATAVGLVLAWRSGGRRFISVRGLARAPLYLLWKLPLYASLARKKGAREWTRTRGLDHD